MKNILVATLVVPALLTPTMASAERTVRPSVKTVAPAQVAQSRSLVVRSSKRAGADLEASNSMFLGLPLLLLAVGAAVVAVAAVAAASDGGSSPGS